MVGRSPYRIVLSDDERTLLETQARSYAAPHREVMRARIVLFAAEGWSNQDIARHLGIPRQIVSKWRHRFWVERMAGLRDRPRRRGPRGSATTAH